MSTRSMTVVMQMRGEGVPLYRHCDGYPAEAGAAIVEVFNNRPRCVEDALVTLLQLRYEGHNGDFRPIYEAATWQPEQQGDLEHVYIISRDTTAPDSKLWTWQVTHYERPARSWDGEHDSYKTWPHATYTPAEWAAVVNKDRTDYNRRLAERHPDAEGYPMVEVIA